MTTPNPWAVLGIKPGASEDEIKEAYKKLAFENHPDLHPGDKAAEDRMKDINVAFEQLMKQPKGIPQTGFAPNGGGQYTYGGYVTFQDLINDLLKNAGKGPGHNIHGYRIVFTGDFDPGEHMRGYSNVTGKPSPKWQQKPKHVEPPKAVYQYSVSEAEAVKGKQIIIDRRGKKLQVKLPPNLKQGQEVRLKNALKATDGIDGDIFIRINIAGPVGGKHATV